MIPYVEINHLRKYAFFKEEVPLLNCHHVSEWESTFSAITYNTMWSSRNSRVYWIDQVLKESVPARRESAACSHDCRNSSGATSWRPSRRRSRKITEDSQVTHDPLIPWEAMSGSWVGHDWGASTAHVMSGSRALYELIASAWRFGRLASIVPGSVWAT